MNAAIGDLIRAIDDDYDNLAHWHPLADYLQERDDPRGELIIIDMAIETGDRSPALVARRTEILAAHAPVLLGETFARVVADGYGAVAWRRGFVDEVVYKGSPNLAHKKAVGWLVKLMTAQHEPFALLRRLDLSYTDFADAKTLLAFPQLVEIDLTATACSDVAPLAALRRLKRVRGHSMKET